MKLPEPTPEQKTQTARLKTLMIEAETRYQQMTPEQQEEMWRKQRESWVRGNIGWDD